MPSFDAAGAVEDDSFTGSDTQSSTTEPVAFVATKTEPSPESELLRGVHDHQTVYTITVTNNRIAPTSDFTVVDCRPAGLEHLGRTRVDNTTGVEYAGAPRLDASPRPAMASTDTVFRWALFTGIAWLILGGGAYFP